ncbi:MAG: hypothetical protein AB7F89_16645, partial [Pirellulaceae bacterium]
MQTGYLSLVMACLACLITGCANSGTSVQGEVTVNGQPLESGEILFVPVDKGESEGAPISGGQYALANSQRLTPGEYQVQIRSFKGTGKKRWDGMGEENNPNKTMVEDMVQFIPEKYNNTSQLTVTLRAGSNDFDA